jgi:hypothetical protein
MTNQPITAVCSIFAMVSLPDSKEETWHRFDANASGFGLSGGSMVSG